MRNDLGGRQVPAIEMGVHPFETAARYVIFNATLVAAPAGNARHITPQDLERIHRQAQMAELAGDIVAPSTVLPSTISPPPTPVPRMMPNTVG